MIVAGLVVGRWWAVPLGAVAWSGLVVAFGDCGWGCVALASLLGAANTAAGVGVHVAVRALLRAVRR